MERRLCWGFVLAIAFFSLSTPAVAHHSFAAEFDQNKPLSFTGTVKKVEWMNPHIYTHVEVKEADGTVVVYRIEGGAPNALFRQGWRKEDMKPGEIVSVSGVRAKNSSSMNVGSATITAADGKRVFGGGAGPPAARGKPAGTIPL